MIIKHILLACKGIFLKLPRIRIRVSILIMTTLTIRISDSVLQGIDALAQSQHAKRSELIRKALASMVEESKKQQERMRLMSVSRRVRTESMNVNADFAAADYELDHEA